MEKKRIARRKKSKIIRTVLHEDCKKCLLEREKEFPLVRAMQNDEKADMNVHILTFTKSMGYMKEMTKVIREFILGLDYTENETTDKGKGSVVEYFDEVEKMICLVYNMKSIADERKI